MSLEGGGIVLFAPVGLAGLATAAVGGALLGGGICVVKAGQGMVSVAQQVDRAIRTRAARQAALQEQCAQYERMLRQRFGQASPASHTSLSLRTELTSRLQARAEQSQKSLPASPSAVPTDAEEEELHLRTEQSSPMTHDSTALDEWRERINRVSEAIEARLEGLRDEAWIGLVRLDDLQDELDELRKAGTAGGVNLNAQLQQLRALDAEITCRVRQAQDRCAERAEAADALEQAAQCLEEKTDELTAQAGMQPVVDVAQDLLERADELFQSGDFGGAREWAGTAVKYLERLTASREEMRRANLKVAIEELENYVGDFGFPPGDQAPIRLHQLIKSARNELKKGDLDGCWSRLQEAQDEVDHLARVVAQRSKWAYRDRVEELLRATLREMEYRVESASRSPEGDNEIVATRADGAGFQFILSANGVLQYEARGFDGLECEREASELFNRLEEKDVKMNVQSRLSASLVAQRLREVLLRQGYSVVEEEADESGVILTGMKKGEETRVRVDPDGRPHPLADKGDAPTDRPAVARLSAREEEELQRAADRQYWRSWRQQMAERRLRV